MFRASLRKMGCPILEKVVGLGHTLPEAMPAAAAYQPFAKTSCGKYVHIAGQLPKSHDGTLHTGKLGGKDDIGVHNAQVAASVCALNLIAQMKEACGGDLSRVKRILKIEGFVASHEDFHEHHLVMNGCSNLLGDVFSKEVADHARFAVGCSSLPFNVPVEVGALIEIE